MAILTNVLESSLNDFDRGYIEKQLEKYLDEAKKHIRDLLLSCTYKIEEVYNKPVSMVLVEVDFNGDYVSSEWIFSDETEF